MTDQHQIHERHRADFEEKARCLRSYVKELTETAARHGTDPSVIENDLRKAKGDIEFYEEQARLSAESLKRDALRLAFGVYKDAAGEWRWRLTASNGRVIADSGQGYRHREDCLHAVELVKGSKDAPVEVAD